MEKKLSNCLIFFIAVVLVSACTPTERLSSTSVSETSSASSTQTSVFLAPTLPVSLPTDHLDPTNTPKPSATYTPTSTLAIETTATGSTNDLQFYPDAIQISYSDSTAKRDLN